MEKCSVLERMFRVVETITQMNAYLWAFLWQTSWCAQ